MSALQGCLPNRGICLTGVSILRELTVVLFASVVLAACACQALIWILTTFGKEVVNLFCLHAFCNIVNLKFYNTVPVIIGAVHSHFKVFSNWLRKQ